MAVRKNTRFISFPLSPWCGFLIVYLVLKLSFLVYHTLLWSLQTQEATENPGQRPRKGQLKMSGKNADWFCLLLPLSPHTSLVMALKRASQRIWLVYGLVKTLHNSLFSFSHLYPASAFFKERAVATQPKEPQRERKQEG